MSSPLQPPQDLLGQSGLYNVPDPLLRRLRLEEPSGQSITDLDKYFRDKEVLVLYAGAEYGEVNLREFHRDLTTFAQRYKSAAVIYVSTDTDPAAPLRILSQKPWLRMTFHDNSDFAPIAKSDEFGVEMEEVSRGEDFVQAGEIEVGVEKVQFGVEEYQNDYVRPLSRAAVTVLMSTFTTPSVAIYHLPTHTFLSKNVKVTNFTPMKVDKNYDTWRNGGSPSLRFKDVFLAMRFPLIALILAVIYHLAVQYGGQQYNVIPKVMDGMSWRVGGRAPQ
ncbi:hypothetical protein CI109_105599 [Kwoniella shandongensis]|uniref:Uncharacterized protein n=1 Tax=Kwoniella shandongensis TaxID=1734106 RepID=A0A5M6C349_9TREE|nr:uncharacterized protein CI109_002316 [Kwoniella shandongensis]KAA5529423.1 hypothetical protein CI109_002316 [Kwoniella shandongensis]